MRFFLAGFILALMCMSPLQAQNAVPRELARYGYPDQIVLNGKVVSMDDKGYNANPGHIYEAMVIEGGACRLSISRRVLSVGSREHGGRSPALNDGRALGKDAGVIFNRNS